MSVRLGAVTHSRDTGPSIKRRLISLVYESVLLFGVTSVAGLLFLAVTGGTPVGWKRHAFQVYLFLAVGLYFTASWRRRGQTLAMKTWKLQVVSANGARITLGQALVRYACAWPSLALGGIGILYAPFDRDRRFLHDRLAGTKITATDDRK